MSIPSPARIRPTPLAVALLVAVAGGQAPAAAQPSGATVVHGHVQVQQQGNSLVVTTRNGGGTRHSAIDWRSFSVPAGTTTRFDQPTPHSTSINRVTGNAPSQILGTLRSNGHLVLVNQNGIAVGAGALVDTAGFAASTLRLSNPDMAAGRLRFNAGGAAGPLSVDGKVLARNGDVVMLGSDLSVGAGAVLQAPVGAVLLAAGQKIELTGRGLEGIRLEVVGHADRVVNLGQLQGDAVGIFAGQLKHSGLVRAARVVRMQDRLHLMTASSARKDDDEKDKAGKGDKDDNGDKGDQRAKDDDRGNGNANRNENRNIGNGGNGGNGNGHGVVANNGGSNGKANRNGGNGNGNGNAGVNEGVSEAGHADSGEAPVAAASPTTESAAVAANAPTATVQTALHTLAVFVDFRAPAVTPAQAVDFPRQLEPYAGLTMKLRGRDPQRDEPDTRAMGGPAPQCTP